MRLVSRCASAALGRPHVAGGLGHPDDAAGPGDWYEVIGVAHRRDRSSSPFAASHTIRRRTIATTSNELLPCVRNIGEVSSRKLAARPALEVLLKSTSHPLIGEVKRNHQRPGAVASCIDVLAGVMPLEALFGLRCQARIVSRLVAVAAKDIDGVLSLHGVRNCMSGTIAISLEKGAIERRHLQPINISAQFEADQHCRK
jgi:hypothetical protein